MRALGIGFIVLACALLGAWAFWHLADPSPRQVLAVTEPFVRLPLRPEPVTHHFAIPDDSAWRAVRRHWGEPQFYLAAVTSDRDWGRRICSQDEAPLAATLILSGEVIALNSCEGHWPYGYSVLSRDAWCHEFEAPLGALGKVTVDASRPSSCELIIVSSYATKDRFVGLSLHDELDRYVNTAALGAGMLGLGGVALIWFGPKKRDLGERAGQQ